MMAIWGARRRVDRFTIPRDRWNRSGGNHYQGDGALLRKDGSQCCVGHYLTACGVPDDILRRQSTADGVDKALPSQAEWLRRTFGSDPQYGNRLYDLNDEGGSEESIADVFALQGITVRFV